VLDNIKRAIACTRQVRRHRAAPIAPDLIKWYRALGVDMREVYGQTENCGLATGMPRPHQARHGRLHRAQHRVEISPEGEILLKGPHVFMGYLNQPRRPPRRCATAGCILAMSASSTTRATCGSPTA
jgi:long-chain acyl-CoA synthetase